MPSCTAIIVAAGSSQRMGFDKLGTRLGGRSVLQRTVEAFVNATSIDSIVVVCPRERGDLLDGIESDKPITRVDGGSHRQQSVQRGLAAIAEGTEWVAVHDGARPLVSPVDIDRCVKAAHKHGAATLARRATETMKRSDADDFSAQPVDRERLWFMETPQVFNIRQLDKAYLQVTGQGLTVTDEVSALQAIGGRVKFVESSRPNLKITTPADLILASAILKEPS